MDHAIIPSPVHCELTSTYVNFNKLRIVDSGLAATYALEMAAKLLDPNSKIPLVFERLESDKKQAYKISIDAKGVIIEGASEIAFVYAVSSLMQIVKFDQNRIALPMGRIFDYPEFSIRGVNWNLLAETRGWSQDDSDGQEAFVRRFISALDLLAKFKLNMVMIDGAGWNSKRFPGYEVLMQYLNSEARRRGIKLCYAGYNAGYGAQWYDFDGMTFKNKKSYPDGEIYACVCSPEHMEQSEKMGTCLSNEKLLILKCNELRDFVRNVEPGALYIHGLDVARQKDCEISWHARCGNCRTRWPNDSVNAADGMAGAYAAFFDQIYDAIASVKNEETGYDAREDCMVNFVSPNYTVLEEKDEDWEFHIEYFSTLYKCIKHKNMYLLLREQLFNYEKSRARFSQLRQAVGDQCKLSCIYFSSGSGFYNSLPVTADVACIKLFEGMDAVCAGSGNAFQEPRQIMNAEYMWNPSSPFKVDIPKQASLESFLLCYKNLCHGITRPESVFGKKGLIEVVCNKLYGDEAGPWVAQAQKMRTPSDSKGGLIAPLWNALLPGWVFSCFKFEGPDITWQESIDEKIIARAKELEILMGELVPLNEKASELYLRAAAKGKRKEHLNRMSKTCAEGAKLASISQRWLKIFMIASDSRQNLQPFDDLQKEVQQEFLRYKKKVSGILDLNGGDLGQAMRTLEFIADDLNAIKYTLRCGQYLERKKSQWW